VSIKIIPLADKKIKVRNISLGMIAETIKSPDQTVKGYGSRTVKQKIYKINNKDKLLRVVCEKEGSNFIVVTAYLTSQVKRYRRKNEDRI
tara:strand:+ start:3452 stop:3721 length:270 start_codon:yes stop_codon:yes gene_type:complete